jgi:hypothetical protein
LNLIRLLPLLSALRLFDNSIEADPGNGLAPQPKLILHCVNGKVVSHSDLRGAPDWTKPILIEALKLDPSRRP